MRSSLRVWGFGIAACAFGAASVVACSTPITTAPDAAAPADTAVADSGHVHDTSHVDVVHHVDTGSSHQRDAVADSRHDAGTDAVSPLDAAGDTGVHSEGGTHEGGTDGPTSGDSGVCPVTSPNPNGTLITDEWAAGSPLDAGVAATNLATLTVADCLFTLFYTASNPAGPPIYSIWLGKSDTGDGLCTSDRGVIGLNSSNGVIPTGFIAANPGQTLLAVTYSYKFGMSDEDYVTSSLTQVDWAEGVPLRQGSFVVTGSAQTGKEPTVTAGSLEVDNCSVTVTGLGSVETPDGGSGTMFTATWVNFLAQAEQNPEDATSAVDSN